MNVLRLGDEHLVPVDYSDLLDKILEALRHQNPFVLSSDRHRLLIDIDTLASQVSALGVQHPLSSMERLAHSASVNFAPDFQEQFPKKIRQIREELRQKLQSVLGQRMSIEQFVASLIAPLDSEGFRGSGSELGFKYDFAKSHQDLQKQKLTLQRLGSGSHSVLKFHKLTISVRNASQFQQQLKEGIENYIDDSAESKSEREDLHNIFDDMVANETSDFYKLIRVVDKETLGKLNKEAKITYLEYLLENIRTTDADPQGVIYLEDLIRRLRLIEEYINDRHKADGDYIVNYAGVEVNYKDLFSRAEVLDSLPIIPIVAGYLGEMTNSDKDGERKFIFGLKLKFDNPVQSRGGDDVFEYNLNLLNPDSEEHKAGLADQNKSESFIRKVLKLAFLYHFVFASTHNPLTDEYHPELELNYDPLKSFEERVLPVLQGGNYSLKKRLFRNFFNRFQEINVKGKIDCLKKFLKKILEQQTILPSRSETRHISVKKGLLEKVDNVLRTGKFFNSVLERNPKQALQYITVGMPVVDDTAICQLSVNITIEDIRYFQTEESQVFSMKYNIKGVRVLPIILPPKADRSRKIYNKHFQNKLLVFPYDNERFNPDKLTETATFVYKITMSLLAYICLLILLENAPPNLFIPMVRLHEGDHANPSPSEKFMAYLSKALSHLLSEKHRSNSQGFRIRREPTAFTIRNGLSSLYSILPKNFKFSDVSLAPELEKLAIIIVSSRESDARKGNSNRFQRKANLLGEVVGINRLEDDTIQVEMLRTFSENYSVSHLYNEPPILADTMSQLYQQGYRHFIYVAQAPYTSTLHITKTEEDEGLYFMSRSLIRTLKGERRDIKIYPIFFDKYYVRSFKEYKGESFYLQDITELETRIFHDSSTSQKAVMFFNLFNGIKVDERKNSYNGIKVDGEKNFYNGVIAYSTLLNIYQGILDDQDIRQGLIYDNLVKETLLNYLTLFHFSRYEARQSISLKLDPYERIIGDESVGALSVFSHSEGYADFNCLAFLTEVRKALNFEKVN